MKTDIMSDLEQIREKLAAMPEPLEYLVSCSVPDVGEDGEPLIVIMPGFVILADNLIWLAPPLLRQPKKMIMSPKTAQHLADEADKRGMHGDATELRLLAQRAIDAAALSTPEQLTML